MRVLALFSGKDMSGIDGVIQRLNEIVDQSKQQRSRSGYFAALYCKVTIRVKERIEQGGYFDDDGRMERLDVIFANRYLDAFDQMQSGRRPTQSWEFAFEVAPQCWPIVLQHLLLGMNAHINLDLGIAAVETVGRDGLADLKPDFNRINDLLADLVGDVQNELTWIWPPLKWLTRHLGGIETVIINFSMEKARDAAWSFAEQLAEIDEIDRPRAIEQRDEKILRLGHAIRYPGFFLNAKTKMVRLGERGTIADIISVLE